MSSYIEIPIETDPEVLAQEAFDLLAARIAGWVPNDANLETIMIEAAARMTAEARDVASAVPTDIFRFFGELVGILPQDATFATSTTDWTMINNAGYTIPANTQIGIRTAGDVLIPFLTDDDTIIPPGSTTALNVPIHAAEAGAASSGITGAVELIDTLDFVTTITLDTTTTGGIDAEDDDFYLNRLAIRLQLFAPRPILAKDFAILAQDIAGVTRAIALDGFNPASTTGATGTTTNASPTITAVSSFTGVTVGSIIIGTNIPLGTFVVAINPGGSTITMDRNVVGSGSGISLTYSGTYNNERMVGVAAVDANGAAISAGLKTQVDDYLQARREVNFVVNVFDPAYTVIDVSFTVKKYADRDSAEIELATETAIADYLHPKNWGFPTLDTGDAPAPEWVNEPVVRYLELAQVLNEVGGVDYVVALTLRNWTAGGAFAAADIKLNGHAPLPQAGTIVGTIT
jgi:Baseplate J-like protein